MNHYNQMEQTRKEQLKKFCNTVICEFIGNYNLNIRESGSCNSCNMEKNRFSKYSKLYGLDKAVDMICDDFLNGKYIEKTIKKMKKLLEKYKNCSEDEKYSVSSDISIIFPIFVDRTYSFFGFDNLNCIHTDDKYNFDDELLTICNFPFKYSDNAPHIEIDLSIDDPTNNNQSDDDQSDDDQSD